MQYRKFIEDNFVIDAADTGKMVPFRFNKVQEAYYKMMCRDYGEKKDFVKLRDIILKARREGFTSLILALFAADMLLTPDARIMMEISYKEDATKLHFRRFKGYIESYFKKRGVSEKDIPKFFDTDNRHEVRLKHNGASFYVGTASSKVGERGGTVQRLLLSEAAHYPNTDVMTAKEIINSSMRMVDINGGWIFIESTANGKGNVYSDMWEQATLGKSRFKQRFFGWRDFYSEEEFKLIESEFSDKEMVKQEYPENPEEAFLVSSASFTNGDDLKKMMGNERNSKKLLAWLSLGGENYVSQCEIIKAWLLQMQREHHTKTLYVGIDVAKHPDETVVTVLADRMTGRGLIRCIAIDSTGIGDFMPDWFERNFRSYVMRVKFSAQQKDAMYKNLKTCIQMKGTELPIMDTDESRLFFKQMVELQMERKGELIVVHHPPGKYHDDYPDSWALAEYGYSFINGIPPSAEPQVYRKKTAAEVLLSNVPEETFEPTQFR